GTPDAAQLSGRSALYERAHAVSGRDDGVGRLSATPRRGNTTPPHGAAVVFVAATGDARVRCDHVVLCRADEGAIPGGSRVSRDLDAVRADFGGNRDSRFVSGEGISTNQKPANICDP